MDKTNPPPGGGTPIKGNRSSIIAIENEKLRNELSELKKIMHNMSFEIQYLKEENEHLKNEITDINTNILEAIPAENNNNDFSAVDDNNMSVSTNQPEISEEFATDEEELERETNWILKKSSKRNNKNPISNLPSNSIIVQDASKKQQKLETINVVSTNSIEAVNTVESFKKILPPPPINVVGVNNFTQIQNIINKTLVKDYKIVALNNDVWKINTHDPESYKSLSKGLNEEKLQWYTYENKNVRPIRVMVRGLHSSCPSEDIINDLKSQNFKVIEAVNMVKKIKTDNIDNYTHHVKKPLPLFMISFEHSESTDRIYEIKYILNMKVKIEAMRKNSEIIAQCKKCQGFNHTQRYCSRDPRCVSCAGKHLSINCVDKTKPPECVNCRSNHPANYRGCEVAKELQRQRKQAIRNKANENRSSKTDKNADEPAIRPDLDVQGPNFKQSDHNSYANISKQRNVTTPRIHNANEGINVMHDVLRLINELNVRMKEQSCINEKIASSLNCIEKKLKIKNI